ncbi:hypothetical protein L210DRAFT_985983 [Boletus edulis BED1]|uniref:Uncharacterized protein n=1 Tax=Boletus edulis BED1 TaxID=1328754 RepID=A0AAD4BHM0_BOLED|nr:hypothetical protein L210DRAFT_985983 [Boletus edulis BED1]
MSGGVKLKRGSITDLERFRRYCEPTTVRKRKVSNNRTPGPELVQRGVSDKDRSSRLLARLLHSSSNYARMMQEERGQRYDIDHAWVDGTDAPAQVLEDVVCHLVSHLGEHNPLIELTKPYQKPPLGFWSPFLPRIAPFVIARKCMNFATTCQFLGIYPDTFLSITHPHGLPYFSAECEIRVLEEVASGLDKKLSILFSMPIQGKKPIRGKKPTAAKRQIIRAFGALITQVREALPSVVMATFQTMSLVPELTDVTPPHGSYSSRTLPHKMSGHIL